MRHAAADRYVEFFETLTPAALKRVPQVFASQARFVDPFNDVRGPDAITGVFEHMFAQCENPHFVVDDCMAEDSRCFLRWRFLFGPESKMRCIEGTSHVRFDASDRVTEHIDFWDPARQLYEDLPILGRLLRRIRHHLSAGQPTQQHHVACDETRRIQP